ncbi:TIGR03768 family metallophosphoesterase [Candidatus Ozemobacteraceae bacterium]|nr:TIGR03768 family metallophosphoesterase [Candidatus Ozemobacteraceae bacterium]
MFQFVHVFKKLCFTLFLGILAVSFSGCFYRDFEDTVNQVESRLERYPISSDVVTTCEKTITRIAPSPSETVRPHEISKYAQNGYGKWTYGPGSPREKRIDIMPDGYKAGTASASLLHFFTMTDVHVTDKESPAQLIYMTLFNSGIGNFGISLYSGIMLYTTHVLDAAIQTVNALHRQKPIDFGITLGDVSNSNQYNELRWYIDIFDGNVINPDSGAKDDPVPGPYNDYQDAYQAAGLDKTIPWYQVIGNHDLHWIGSKPVSSYIRQTLIGENILNVGNVLLPGGLEKRDYYMGTLDGRTLLGDIYGAGPVASFSTTPKVAADPNRRSLSRSEWMGEFFNTSSKPSGHGFSQANVANGFGCYSFEPKSDMPVKVIVLDNTVNETTPGINSNYIYGYGTLDRERYDWLVSELQEGQANNKLMIIAAHIPIGVEPLGSSTGWWTSGYVTDADDSLLKELHKYPNLMLWISGHRHLNTIKPFKSPDPARPELGFWGVETVSLREFPQQFRTFEIVRNSDRTISILATNVDPAVQEGSFAATSRSYAVAAGQLYGLEPEASRNAELVKQLSPEMQTKIQNYGTPTAK